MFTKPVQDLRTEQDLGKRIRYLLGISVLLYLFFMVVAVFPAAALVLWGWKPDQLGYSAWFQGTGVIMAIAVPVAQRWVIQAKKQCSDGAMASSVVIEIRKKAKWPLRIAQALAYVVFALGVVITTFGGSIEWVNVLSQSHIR